MQAIKFTTSGRILALTSILTVASSALAFADDEHKHGTPLHGGRVEMTPEYHIEVVYLKNGLLVYPRTHDDEVIDVKNLTGTVTFFHPNSPKPWFQRPLVPGDVRPGETVEAIGLKLNMSKIPAKGAKIEFQISGLPNAAKTTENFIVPFSPPAAPQAITYAKATKADEAAIAAQQVCKVSGEDLFAMGGPVKVTRGGKSTFICCKNCLKSIQSDPDKFLGSASAATPKADASEVHAP